MPTIPQAGVEIHGQKFFNQVQHFFTQEKAHDHIITAMKIR